MAVFVSLGTSRAYILREACGNSRIPRQSLFGLSGFFKLVVIKTYVKKKQKADSYRPKTPKTTSATVMTTRFSFTSQDRDKARFSGHLKFYEIFLLQVEGHCPFVNSKEV